MTYEVHLGARLMTDIAQQYGEERSVSGAPSRYDFESVPLAAAVEAFRNFDSLHAGDEWWIRSVETFDPVFGPVVFTGALIAPGQVEIARFEAYPGYWNEVSLDPDDD